MKPALKWSLLLIGLSLWSLGCAALNTVERWVNPPQSGETLYSDDFSTGKGDWSTWNGNGSAVDYDSGGLRFYINQPDLDYWSTLPGEYSDVRIEATSRQMSGPSDNHYGILCRFKDSKTYYAFLISSDGYYGIIKVLDGQYSVLSDTQMQYSDIIFKDTQTNYLKVECNGSKLIFTINGRKLAEVEDVSIASGKIGLMSGTYSNLGVDILFDNLYVYMP